jgi:curved DNA-binding protein CbpA
MQNYYELLGVSRTASPSVVKIAYEGKLKALERAELPEAEKAAERRELERAYVTLGNPAKKTWYDGQLDRRVDADAAAMESSSRRGLTIASVVAVVAVAAIGWYFVDRARERERIRLDEQRIALEREAVHKADEIERVRLEQAQQRIDLQRDTTSANLAARERAYNDARARSDASQQAQLRREVYSAQVNADRAQQSKDRADRAAAEADRRRAQAEVERQKKFVRQREIEDERARQDRYMRAQYEDIKRKAAEAAADRPH